MPGQILLNLVLDSDLLKSKMKNKVLFLIFISFTLTTCKKDHLFDCFKSAGKTITENRSVSPFININLDNNVDLIIHPNTGFYIKVTAGKNIIDGITTELSGNTLYIRNENRCNWMRSFKNTYTVEVGMDKPSLIHYEGSGDITCIDTIRTDEFTFDCYNGSGSINLLLHCNKTHLNHHIGRSDFHVTGISGESYIYVNDVGTFDGSALNADYCYIRSSSTGDCRINVKNELGFEIKYSGNIYYTGEPHIYHQEFNGTGKLIHY